MNFIPTLQVEVFTNFIREGFWLQVLASSILDSPSNRDGFSLLSGAFVNVLKSLTKPSLDHLSPKLQLWFAKPLKSIY